MYIEKEIEINFLDEALSKLTLDYTTEKCPHCGHIINRIPVARKSDIRAFRELLNIMNKYLNDEGVPEKILGTLMDRINARLSIQ
jgi:hypothetical protein